MKSKKILVIPVVIMLVVLFCVFLFTRAPANEEDKPSTTTSAPEETLPLDPVNPDNVTPEFQSPYNYDDRLYRLFLPVFDSAVIADGVTFTSPSQPDQTFLDKFDVADVITLTLPKQPLEVDIAHLKMYGFAHENMMDPFLNSIDKFENPIFIASFSADTETENITAQAMIGYGTSVQTYFDIVVTYKDRIIFYSIFAITDQHIENLDFWKDKYPNETFEKFYIKCGDTTYTKYYVPAGEDTNLYTWRTQFTNTTMWFEENNYLVSAKKSWMIHPDDCKKPLQPGATYTAIPYEERAIDFTFETDNPEYALYFLGKSQNEVVSHFGNPLKTNTNNKVTCLEYSNYQFFVVDDKVEQITLDANSLEIINGVPNFPATVWEIEAFVKQCGLVFSEAGDAYQDPTIPEYYASVPIMNVAEGWTITFVWLKTEMFQPTTSDCDKIIIHTGERYLY